MYNMHYERRTIEKRNQIPIPRRCALSPPPRNVVGGERYPVKSSIFGGKMKTKSRFMMIVLVFVLGISLVSCGGGKPAGPVTIKVLTMQQAGPTPEEMNAIV